MEAPVMDSSRAGGSLHHRPSGLRTHGMLGRSGQRQSRLQRLQAPIARPPPPGSPPGLEDSGRPAAREELATTQHHFSMEGRDIIRAASAEEVRTPTRTFASATPCTDKPSLHAGQAAARPRPLCVGHVGRSQHLHRLQRLRHRLPGRKQHPRPSARTRSPQGSRDALDPHRPLLSKGLNPTRPRILHQPVTCMQCEKAPCEVVCPVAATVHDDEGLNAMVYNRCVGTRYLLEQLPVQSPPLQLPRIQPARLKLRRSPSARTRTSPCAASGVMEKCTYCVQRINRRPHPCRVSKIRKHPRRRNPDRVPAGVPGGGDRLRRYSQDAGSRVSANASAEPVNYSLLDELDTQPPHHLPRPRHVTRMHPKEGT